MPEQNPRADYDGAWKEALKRHLPLFLDAYFPDVEAKIDFSKPIEWLDKELEKLISHSAGKSKQLDLLARVSLDDGSRPILLVHIEVQSEKDEEFAKRLHRYWSGIYFQTGEDVISLAILADATPNWCPAKSVFEFAGFRSELTFPVCKLLALPQTQKGLPFEVARAQLDALRTTGDPQERYRAKKELLLNLYDGGYGAQDVREIYMIVNHMMLLSKELEKQLDLDIIKVEKEKVMPYITSIERTGIEKGIEKGIQKGIEKGEIAERQRMVRNMFNQGVPPAEISKLTDIPLEEIQEILDSE